MNNYETIVILQPSFTDEQANEKIDNYKKLIADNGQVNATEYWGKRKLAYPVQKKNEGIYALIDFKADAEFIDELNRQYNIDETILKHIIVKKD